MSPKDRQKIDPSRIQKILLIRLRRIGDVILTTPAVAALRKAFPLSFISYVVEEPYRDLVEGNPCLNKVYVLKKNQSPKDLLRLIRLIRRENSDTVIDFHGGPRASLIALLSGAKWKIGYKIKYRNFIYDIGLPRSSAEGPIHSAENHLNLVRALGVDVDPSPPVFVPAPLDDEAEKINKFTAEKNLEGQKTITIHIGAGNEFRDWGEDNWTELIGLLSGHPQVKIVLIGAAEDRKRAQEILSRSGASPHSLAGELNLREVRELIARSALFVGPDSGPMHIAASTSTPIVALFGPTLPAHFSPWRARAAILEKDLDCRPCRQRKCIHEDFRCIRSIRPEEVYNACLPFI